MIVVSNTTPILSLYKIGMLQLIKQLFAEISVPRAVYEEISIYGRGMAGCDVIDKTKYIRVKDVTNKLAVNLLRSQLDYGEAETIVLANEINADLLLIDEKKARRIAQANNQKIIGTIGLLQLAKEKGIVKNMKPLLDMLIHNGIWINGALYNMVLHNNNEA